MELRRTKDYATVRQILTNRDIYELMGDDYLPRPEAFVVNTHSEIWYVLVRHADRTVGLFSLFPRNACCWDLHVAMLPEADTKQKWAAARDLAPWLSIHTECKRLVGEVPRTNTPAVYYCTHGVGMRYVGTHPKAFQKHGVLTDLIILGMEIGNGAVA